MGGKRVSRELPLPDDHLIRRIARHLSQRTDAPGLYLLTGAAVAVAAATPGVKAFLGPFPNGLGTNLYAALVGPTTKVRKSTVLDLVEALVAQAVAGAVIDRRSTPEAFAETLAERSGDTSLWVHDEFAQFYRSVVRRSHMEGLKELLLAAYDGRSYGYRRTAKRDSNGVKRPDRIEIRDPHFSCLVAGTTDRMLEVLRLADVEEGTLPRFIIAFVEKPTRQLALRALTPAQRSEWRHLVEDLGRLYRWCRQGQQAGSRVQVSFAPSALGQVEALGEVLQQMGADDPERYAAYLDRLHKVLIKLSMLVAVGDADFLQSDAAAQRRLRVTDREVTMAWPVVERWALSGIRFLARIGEHEHLVLARRALELVERLGNQVDRREIMRRLHVTARQLEAVEETLVARGDIVVRQVKPSGGKAKLVWAVPANDEDDETTR